MKSGFDYIAQAEIECKDGPEGEAVVRVHLSGTVEIFDQKIFNNRRSAMSFIKDAYPESDVRTVRETLL